MSYKVKEFKKKYVRRFAGVADLHVGSGYAILPKMVSLREGGSLYPSPEEELIWSYWKDFNDQCNELEVDTAIINGDIIHGTNHKDDGRSVIFGKINLQIEVAVEILRPFCNGRQSWFFQGSEYHSGSPNNDFEENICKELKGEWFGQSATIGIKPINKVIQITHATSTSPKEEIKTVDANKGVEKGPKIDLLIKAHKHGYFCFQTDSATVVQLPCWTGFEPSRITRKRENEYLYTHTIGGVLFLFDEKGNLEVKPILKTRKGEPYRVVKK
jgi:metallophosphoesterase superfamily enzyme